MFSCQHERSANDAKHKPKAKQLLKAIKKQQRGRRTRRFLRERQWFFLDVILRRPMTVIRINNKLVGILAALRASRKRFVCWTETRGSNSPR